MYILSKLALASLWIGLFSNGKHVSTRRSISIDLASASRLLAFGLQNTHTSVSSL